MKEMCTADEIMAQLGRPLAICSEPVDEDRANAQASSMIKSELIEGMGFNRRKTEDRRRDAAEKEKPRPVVRPMHKCSRMPSA